VIVRVAEDLSGIVRVEDEFVRPGDDRAQIVRHPDDLWRGTYARTASSSGVWQPLSEIRAVDVRRPLLNQRDARADK